MISSAAPDGSSDRINSGIDLFFGRFDSLPHSYFSLFFLSVSFPQ